MLYNNVIQSEFGLCPLDDSLFHGVFCDETEDVHLFLLTDSMSTILPDERKREQYNQMDTHDYGGYMESKSTTQRNVEVCSMTSHDNYEEVTTVGFYDYPWLNSSQN